MAKITVRPECDYIVIHRRKKYATSNRVITETFYFESEREGHDFAKLLTSFEAVFVTSVVKRRGFRGILYRFSRHQQAEQKSVNL